MHARVLAVEQENQTYPIKVLALAPGVVDTAMQDLIREQTAERFPMLDRFVSLKENDQLVNPQTVAGRIVDLLQSEEFGNEILMDLREN